MKDSWCHVSVDGKATKAKILHKGRGRFEIVETQDGKHVGRTIDASEVYNCRECDKADRLFLVIAVDTDKLKSISGILSSPAQAIDPYYLDKILIQDGKMTSYPDT